MVRKNIEAIYPLSPMQQGFLFHTLLEPEKWEYLAQFCCVIRGDFNAQAFKSAWRSAVERHALLRTAFVWEQLDDPLQIVRERVKLNWNDIDWRGSTAIEHQQK